MQRLAQCAAFSARRQLRTSFNEGFSFMMPNVEGCRVLVVEDESAVLMLVEDMLVDLGFAEIATAMGVQEALPMAEAAQIDLAILDINLGEQRSFPIAARLRERGVPFFFATGYGSKGLDDEWIGSVVLKKPFRLQELAAAIARVLAPEPRAPRTVT